MSEEYIPEDGPLTQADIEAAYQRGLREGQLMRNVAETEERAQQVSAMYEDDATGQDGEEHITSAWGDVIAARDELHKERDPEGYAEQKHFEACARYLP